MREYFVVLISAWTFLLALGGGPAAAYIADDRWTRTATNGSNVGTQGSPITVTWSFAPDGTLIPGNTTGTTVASNLLATLDANFGAGPGGSDLTQRPWFPIFSQSYDRLSALCGVTYVYESHDDSHNFSGTNSTSFRGVLGVRGDVRLGGKSYGAGSNILASNFFPDYGDMMINTDQTGFFLNSANNYRAFRNTLMHESMHGLGISHVESSDAGFLIEPFLSTSFDGPQLDDLLAIQRLYGDVHEKNGGNDISSQATSLGTVSAADAASIGTLGNSTQIQPNQADFLSIDDDSDTDYFSFTIGQRLDVSLQLTPRGTTYMVGPEGGTQSSFDTLTLSNLSLSLFGTDGATLLTSVDANPAGLGEQIARQLLPGTYFARVKGANNDIQLYGLNLSATVPLPKNLVWVGNLSANWNTGTTANFDDGSAPSVFYDLDNATFSDTSVVHNVSLPGNISAGTIHVTTAGTYQFAGPGGIVAGNLTVDGSGVVELANSGNSYAGATQVVSGTLKISGSATAMVSTITVASGATLVIASNTSLASSLTLAGSGGDGHGALQIAASQSVQLQGDVNLAGGGATIGADTNSSGEFSGPINGSMNNGNLTLRVASGGNVVLHGAIQLGTGGVTKSDTGTAELGGGLVYSGATIVQQGTLRLTGSGTMAGEFDVATGAVLELGGTHQFTSSSRLTGGGQVVGDLTMPGTIAPGPSAGVLTLTDDLTLLNTSHIEMEIGGTHAAIDYDSLQIGGLANLAGTVDVSLIAGFAPEVNDSFQILHAENGIFNQFDHLELPVIGQQLAWNVIYSNFSVLLQIIASNFAVLPGDYNQDGVVDAADYVVWRHTLGQSVDQGTGADGDGDGQITDADYGVWISHFGDTSGGGGGSTVNLPVSAAVPEPGTLLLLVSGLATRILRRRPASSSRVLSDIFRR